jgi:N-acetylneuraminate synthase/N,N'-diacetyllegionaminate synthase
VNKIKPDGKVLIIAEAGVNHNGDISLALKLIDVAVDAGADFVKFQTFKTVNMVSELAVKAYYQKLNTSGDESSQFKMLKKLELGQMAHIQLRDYCITKGIHFLSSAFDEESIDLLENLGLEIFKIPSGEITNKPYLKYIAQKGKPVIMSTGMADMEEIRAAIKVLIENGLRKKQITLLHCNTEYPTPFEDVNLLAMLTIRDKFGVKVGYSDHTQGIEIPIAAVALGARIIEKHFTLDRNLPGPDHKASLNPEELKSMVQAIRNVELATSGTGIKTPSKSEKRNIENVRKSIHLRTKISAGTVISSEHLIMKRPGIGISPMEIDKIIGKTITLDLEANSLLSWDHIAK